VASARSAAARTWATVLSELAGIPVVVEWESPSWRVRWVDGPTRTLLLDRATALGGYGVGAPLAVTQLGFARRVSPVAIAVGWLMHGSEITESERQRGMTAEYAVEQWCTDTSYPQQRAGVELSAAARVLTAVGRGDEAVMATLMTSARPPVEPTFPGGRIIDDLPGRVVSYRWPGRGGPPQHLLQPSKAARLAEHATPPTYPPTAATASPPTAAICRQCGGPLPPRSGTRGGRPAQYCSARCRVAAHRSRPRLAAR